MNARQLRAARRRAGWTQDRLASRLGVTQAYLSLMEHGRRRVPDHVARATANLLGLPATVLPMSAPASVDATLADTRVALALARLGYPGLAYLAKPGAKMNPGELLLRALAVEELEPRLVEALPWLLLRFDGFDTEAMAVRAKMRDRQNRLGFTVSLARQIAERNPRYRSRLDGLRRFEALLERSRLVREETYGLKEASPRMRKWLRANRSGEARHWNLLTDLKVEHLPYAGEDPGTVAELPA
jgi:transcriptional regulator with XRE-family HTH domain